MSNDPITTPVRRQPSGGAPPAPNTTGQLQDSVPPELMVQVPPHPSTDPRGSSLYRNALLGIRPPTAVSAPSPSLGEALQAQQQALFSAMNSIQEIPHETDERPISEIASDTVRQDADDFEYQQKVLSDERARLEEIRRDIETRASELRAQQREIERYATRCPGAGARGTTSFPAHPVSRSFSSRYLHFSSSSEGGRETPKPV